MNKNGIILGILFIVVFIGGFLMGRFTAPSSYSITSPSGVSSATTQSAPSNTSGITSSTTASTSAATGSQVPASSLTDSQKAMLKMLGIDPNNFTITPAMVACADAKLGAARVEEIKNGATPSFTEGASLVACYR